MTKRESQDPQGWTASLAQAPTRRASAAGAEFVYRDLGVSGDGGVPLVGLTHLGANLDSWDPEVVDPIAGERRVVLIGYRGVGASTGSAQDTVEDVAADVIAVIRALGLARVDVLGLSMGGMVAQALVDQAPDLVDRVVLAGSGPQGGPGLTHLTGVFLRGVLRALATFRNPTSVLFFTRTETGKSAAMEYQARLKRSRVDTDKPVGLGVLRAQLRAVNRWGQQPSTSPRSFPGRVLILHGDSDRLVPPANSDALLQRFPGAQARMFTDSGHGVSSQNHRIVTELVNQFLQR